MQNWSGPSSQIDITPTNFQYPTKYPCIICYERCSEPLSCIQCKQIICFKHIERIEKKCPNCRLAPFKYQRDSFLKSITEYQLKKQRDILISKATFTCLVQGCDFQGKYHKMDIHRRRQHRNQELKDILFPDEREKKRKRQIIQKLFIKILLRKQLQLKLNKRAKQIYQTSNKKASSISIYKMLCHISDCTNQKCKNVYIQKQLCFIGDQEKNPSECQLAKIFLNYFDS